VVVVWLGWKGFQATPHIQHWNSRTELVICIIDLGEIPSGHQIGFYRQELAWVGGSQDARNYILVTAPFSCSSIPCDPSPAICSATFQSSIYAQ
jgi:hypothetical protein